MSRQRIAFSVADISAFSRALSEQLAAADAAPSHLSLMNMLARAGGWRNFQHLRASEAAAARLAHDAPEAAPADLALVERAFRLFDSEGRLAQFPARRRVQMLCLWAMWARLPAERAMHERELNTQLNRWHHFADPALLRRDMVAMGLLRRNADGSDYWRVGRQPPGEALALIRRLPGGRAER